MTTTLALIGAGNIGGTLARLAVAAGLDVVLSNSRGPQTLTGLVGELGPSARAASVVDAAEAGDLVVVSLPWGAHAQLPAGALAGKTVIDTMNFYPERDGVLNPADAGLPSSVLVQRRLSGSHVVKAFNNIDFRRLLLCARPAGAPDRSGLPIAADDDGAKAESIRLLDRLGYDAVDLGGLAGSWRSEPGTPVYVHPYLAPGGLSPEQLRPGGLSSEERQRLFFETLEVPVPAATVRDLLDAAVRPQ
jgi:predicted dinucleotide-binding enzyme